MIGMQDPEKKDMGYYKSKRREILTVHWDEGQSRMVNLNRCDPFNIDPLLINILNVSESGLGMDCQTLKLEPIKHEKARLATFKKRKLSLMKKANELSTLCDIEACIILYGPKVKGQPSKPETWTSKDGDLTSIIREYKKKISAGNENRAKQVDDAATRTFNKKNCIGKNFTTWDQRIDSLSEDQLKMILSIMDDKLKVADRKLNKIKEDQNMEIQCGGESGSTIIHSVPLNSWQSYEQTMAPGKKLNGTLKDQSREEERKGLFRGGVC